MTDRDVPEGSGPADPPLPDPGSRTEPERFGAPERPGDAHPEGDSWPAEEGGGPEEEYAAGRGWMLRTVAVIAIIGLLALFVARPATERDVEPPEFDLPLLEGGGSITSSGLRGRPVVLNFWASWCEPCREEAPLFEETWQRYRDRGVVVLGVNVRDRPEDARRFVDEEGLTFPIVTDYDGVIANELAVFGLPQTFFIDPSWRFHDEHVGGSEGRETPGGFPGAGRGVAVLGAISEERLESSIREMLGESP